MRAQGELPLPSLPVATHMDIGAKIVFLSFRQQTHTLQGVLAVSGDDAEHQVSKQMLKFAQLIPVS